jgi:hypothetical protein
MPITSARKETSQQAVVPMCEQSNKVNHSNPTIGIYAPKSTAGKAQLLGALIYTCIYNSDHIAK